MSIVPDRVDEQRENIGERFILGGDRGVRCHPTEWHSIPKYSIILIIFFL